MSAVSRHRLLAFAAVLITAIYLIPVYWMLNTSFKGAEDIFATPPDLLPLPRPPARTRVRSSPTGTSPAGS